MDQSAYIQMRDVESRHWWFRARRDILQRIIERKLGNPVGARILEVGCGTGGNLAMLSRFGHVTGMEMNALAVRESMTRSAAVILHGRVPEDLPDSKYDLVALLDVLEHIEDDVALLQALRGNIAANGFLLLTVPAYTFLWSHHDIVVHHYRRYTQSRLAGVLENNGYTLRYISYFNTILFPLVAATRIVKRRLGGTSSDLTMPGAFLNRIFYGLFASERHLLPAHSLPFGVSIVAIAVPMHGQAAAKNS